MAACADLKELSAINGALRQRFGVMPELRLNNRTNLSVTLRNDESAAKLDSAGRAELANEVALFVRDHYPEASQFEDISVAFATVSETGPVTITRTDAPYRFSMAELKWEHSPRYEADTVGPRLTDAGCSARDEGVATSTCRSD